MRSAKIVFASSALTLALASAVSAASVYDTKVWDPDAGTGSSSQNITSAQDSYVLPYAPVTNRFFTITLGAAASATNYSVLIDNQSGNGGTYQGVNGIDYYWVSRGDQTATTLYKWNGSAFVTSNDFAPALSKSNSNKTLSWEVFSNLGPRFGWYATASKYNGNKELYDSTSRVSATPIPGAIWLVGSGLLGLVGLKRRSKDIG